MKQLIGTHVFENKLKHVCTGSFAFAEHSQNQLLLILCIHGTSDTGKPDIRYWKANISKYSGVKDMNHQNARSCPL